MEIAAVVQTIFAGILLIYIIRQTSIMRQQKEIMKDQEELSRKHAAIFLLDMYASGDIKHFRRDSEAASIETAVKQNMPKLIDIAFSGLKVLDDAP